MTRWYISSFLVCMLSFVSSGQVGINTNTPHSSAALDITSTNQGLLPPRMTEGQRDAISCPCPAGLMIWCIDCGNNGQMQVYNGIEWTDMVGSPAASFICGSNVTFSYNGNNVTYGTVTGINGRCWLDRNLGASRVATDKSDEDSFGDLFQWGRAADGHQLRTSNITSTLSNTDQPGHGDFISDPGAPFLDWRNPQNSNLWQGLNGINNPCPPGYRIPLDVEWEAERISWNNAGADGAFESSLKLPAGLVRSYFDGTIYSEQIDGNYWSSSVSNLNSVGLYFNNSGDSGLSFPNRMNGLSVRCVKGEIITGSIESIDCIGSTINGTLVSGEQSDGVTAMVPYSNGNGGVHNGLSVQSIGVTGLNAYLAPGLFANGPGHLIFNISGIPSGAGIAQFELNLGGKSCILEIDVAYVCGAQSVTFMYNGTEVTYGIVVGANNRCWLDRNLGASQVATSSNDQASYGDLFQWGRDADGHQIRTSNTTTTLSNSDQPGHGDFILATGASFHDWRSPANDFLWQGVSGINNPCPAGFRLPSETELSEELTSWITSDEDGAFASSLKLPLSGARNSFNGNVEDEGFYSGLWSSTAVPAGSRILDIANTFAVISIANRAGGYSVRCIME